MRRGYDERASEVRSARRALPPLLAPLSGLRVEREKHRRTFEGSTATPTGVVAVTPAYVPLSATRVLRLCYVSPAALTPPPLERRARHPLRFFTPRLSPYPFLPPPLLRYPLTPLGSGEEDDATLGASTRSSIRVYTTTVELGPRESQTRSDQGMLTILLSRYPDGSRSHDLNLQLRRVPLSSQMK